MSLEYYVMSHEPRFKPSTPVQSQSQGSQTEPTSTTTPPGYRYLKNPSVTHLLCAICCKKDGRLCTACGHVAYCSPKCQALDWPNHKKICRSPAIINKDLVIKGAFNNNNSNVKKEAETGDKDTIADDPIVSNIETGEKPQKPEVKPYTGKLMSRRDICSGEIIVSAQPIMMACNDKGMKHPPDSILCLTCCKWYQSSAGYRCSSCHWPVCSIECEKGSLHSKFECPLLTSRRIKPPPAADHTQFFHDAILALRCVLLKKIDPPKYDELFEWKAICTKQRKYGTWIEYDKRIIKFLSNDCNISDLLQMSKKDLADHLMVIDACSLFVKDRIVIHASEFGKSFFCAKYVFPIKLLVSEECSPNCKWSIKHSAKLEDCSLRIHAALNMKPGTYMTASFSEVSEYGTSFPGRYSGIRFNHQCTCRRCTDPTELGSFFSAVVCQECDGNSEGYILPIEPGDLTTDWECRNSKCKKRIKGSFVLKDINRIYSEILEAGNDFYALVNLIYKYEQHTLHPNHFLILKAATTCVELFWGSVRGLPFFSPRYDFFTTCINLAHKAIKILDIIAPGGSIQRARILFQLQVAYAYKHLRDFRRYLEWGGYEDKLISTVFWELQKIQEEAYAVLITEPYGSLEHEMSVVLQEVIEDQLDLLCHTPRNVPMDYTCIFNLHKIYSRFSNEYYYPAIPIFEDKDIHEFIISTGPCARHMIEKINATL